MNPLDALKRIMENKEKIAGFSTHEEVDRKTYLQTELLVLDAVVFHKYANPVVNALYFHDDSIPPKNSWFGKKKIIHIGRMVFY